jgi:LPXTG-motif cell wall-anchored protein
VNRTTRIRPRPAGPLVLAAAGVAVALLGPGRAAAHDIRAAVPDPNADPIRVEAAFDDDTPADGVKVTVADAAGAVVAAGVTDGRGVWAFPRPGPGAYTIVVEGFGHRAEVGLTVPGAGGPAEVTSRWRLDKRIGLAVGLAVLLGGSALYARRRKKDPSP